MTIAFRWVYLVCIGLVSIAILGCGGGGGGGVEQVGSAVFTYGWPDTAPFGADEANSLTVEVGGRHGFLQRPYTSICIDRVPAGPQSYIVQLFTSTDGTGDPIVEVRGLLEVSAGDTVTEPLSDDDLTPAVTLTVAPNLAFVTCNQSVQFVALLEGADDTRVSWAVEETGGGSITQNGLYTAGQSAGTFHVKATSLAYPSVSTRVAVVVQTTSGNIIIQ